MARCCLELCPLTRFIAAWLPHVGWSRQFCFFLHFSSKSPDLRLFTNQWFFFKQKIQYKNLKFVDCSFTITSQPVSTIQNPASPRLGHATPESYFHHNHFVCHYLYDFDIFINELLVATFLHAFPPSHFDSEWIRKCQVLIFAATRVQKCRKKCTKVESRRRHQARGLVTCLCQESPEAQNAPRYKVHSCLKCKMHCWWRKTLHRQFYTCKQCTRFVQTVHQCSRHPVQHECTFCHQCRRALS